MNKIKLGIALICSVVVFASCGSSLELSTEPLPPPTAVSTINAVGLEELNLTRDDYQILKTVTANATVYNKEGIAMYDEDKEFSIIYGHEVGAFFGKTRSQPESSPIYSGLFKMGYLSNETHEINYDNPFDLAHRLAIYRIINLSQVEGADGIIEPVVSTVVSIEEGVEKVTVTVRAKLVVLKTE